MFIPNLYLLHSVSTRDESKICNIISKLTNGKVLSIYIIEYSIKLLPYFEISNLYYTTLLVKYYSAVQIICGGDSTVSQDR